MALNILGLIPARGGSQGIPRKNLLTLGGKSLIELAVESARESELISRTVVSSDDMEIIEAARAAGGEAPFVRPGHLGRDQVSPIEVVRHAVDWLAHNQGWPTEVAVILQPTSPFRRGEHIDATLRLLLDSGAEAAMTVCEVDYSPYWMLRLDEEGRLSRFIDDGQVYTRRQDTPRVHKPNGMVYAIRAQALPGLNFFPFNNARGLVVSREESVNVDHPLDWRLAQLLWQDRSGRK